MKNKIIISEQFRDYLEGLLFEKVARSNLILFMIKTNKNNKEMFNKIHSEYMDFFIKYELAKKELENFYIVPQFGINRRWNLDFKSREVTIYE